MGPFSGGKVKKFLALCALPIHIFAVFGDVMHAHSRMIMNLLSVITRNHSTNNACCCARLRMMTGPSIYDLGPVFERLLCLYTVRSTTSLGTLVMGFNETKYVSKKPLQFESTLYKNALCQNSAFDLSGLTHSDSFLCFPIVLL